MQIDMEWVKKNWLIIALILLAWMWYKKKWIFARKGSSASPGTGMRDIPLFGRFWDMVVPPAPGSDPGGDSGTGGDSGGDSGDITKEAPTVPGSGAEVAPPPPGPLAQSGKSGFTIGTYRTAFMDLR